MRTYIALLMILTSCQIFSQTISYGFVFGLNATDMENSIPTNTSFATSDMWGFDGFNIGVYYDYRLGKKFGIKSYLTYNNENETYDSSSYDNYDKFNINVRSIQLSPTFKYHLKREYNKGGYLFSGPRISAVVGTKNKSLNIGAYEIYKGHKSFNFGFQLGYGFNLFKFMKMEIVGDHWLSNIIESDEVTIKAYNLKLNFSLDIKKLKK